MKTKPEIVNNDSTEEKIKDAARRVFTRKGYVATRTRDIAEESGFNLALINYYFRSKEKLFDMIMLEPLQSFVHSIIDIINDPKTSLQQKIEILVAHYIDMLIENPDLPLFILSEVNADPEKLIAKVGINALDAKELYIAKQWKSMATKKKLPKESSMHFLMNIVSLTIFPFIARPLIKNRTGMTTEQFNAVMEERKRLIPIWINAMIMA
jgi:AcrR family transcriptional regulator